MTKDSKIQFLIPGAVWLFETMVNGQVKSVKFGEIVKFSEDMTLVQFQTLYSERFYKSVQECINGRATYDKDLNETIVWAYPIEKASNHYKQLYQEEKHRVNQIKKAFQGKAKNQEKTAPEHLPIKDQRPEASKFSGPARSESQVASIPNSRHQRGARMIGNMITGIIICLMFASAVSALIYSLFINN